VFRVVVRVLLGSCYTFLKLLCVQGGCKVVAIRYLLCLLRTQELLCVSIGPAMQFVRVS